MRFILILPLMLHGLIHLMGFVKGFKLAEISQLTRDISRRAGALWLFVSLLFVAGAILLLFRSASWWIPTAPAIILSQVLIIRFWQDAKFGTLVNLLLLVPLFVAVMGSIPSSFRITYSTEVQKRLQRSTVLPVVRQEDLARLPKPVQNYLVHAGVVGKPGARNLHVHCKGQIRMKMDGGWMDFTSDQYNFLDEPARLYFIESSMFTIPFQGLHLYTGPAATMQIKAASTFLVVDAKGPEMNKSETVTLFNDMCVLAPSSLLSAAIQWEPVDSFSSRATFTNAGHTITALLSFNEKGELVNFRSDDRYLSADGKTYKQYPWTTPLSTYRDFGGMNLASYGEAIWNMPEGKFVYGRMTIESVEYNCTTFE